MDTYDLFFECEGVSNTCSFLTVNVYELQFETEEIKQNSNPKYLSSLKVNFYFESPTIVKVNLCDDKKSKTIIGSYECSLMEILCKKFEEKKF